MWKLFAGVAGAGLLLANCTIKTDDSSGSAGAGNTTSGECSPVGKKVSGCTCAGNLVSYQVCTSEGIYGDCVCESGNGGASSAGASNAGASNAGASYTAGYGGSTTNGGSSSSAGEGGEGGEGGAAPIIDPNDCYDCLNKLCQLEWDDCVLEDENNPETPGNYCLSSNADGTGQIEAVLACIEAERSKGLVKRDAVRACGASLGKSSDPSFFLWPPTDMTAVTAQVLNCMADDPDEMNPGTWANSNNIPNNGSPKPWLDNTCAKLSCTSAQTN
ncbi:MAG TPA: hypothetical protein VGJ91_04630 [Polyangiaceae bacterium]